jgi:hypothetical protein
VVLAKFWRMGFMSITPVFAMRLCFTLYIRNRIALNIPILSDYTFSTLQSSTRYRPIWYIR